MSEISIQFFILAGLEYVHFGGHGLVADEFVSSHSLEGNW